MPPVIIECKYGGKKLSATSQNVLKTDDASIKNFAVNGVIYYAQSMIASGKYSEVTAIGIAGDDGQTYQNFSH